MVKKIQEWVKKRVDGHEGGRMYHKCVEKQFAPTVEEQKTQILNFVGSEKTK